MTVTNLQAGTVTCIPATNESITNWIRKQLENFYGFDRLHLRFDESLLPWSFEIGYDRARGEYFVKYMSGAFEHTLAHFSPSIPDDALALMFNYVMRVYYPYDGEKL